MDHLKAHLVAKGYIHIYGSDNYDTISHVAKTTSVRLLLFVGAMRSWPLHQLDIKNVLLHGDLTNEVYIGQPPCFVVHREFGLVCRLRCSLYGLKQSPRAWFGQFSSMVQEFGMTRSTSYHCVFHHHTSSRQCIYLIVYVTDITISSEARTHTGQLRIRLDTAQTRLSCFDQ